MLVACRLAGLSAFEGHYGSVKRARNAGADAGKLLEAGAGLRPPPRKRRVAAQRPERPTCKT